MWKVEDAQPEDHDWIKKLFTKNKSILGNVASSVVWRWTQRPPDKLLTERFVVVRPHGFAHFYVKKDGETTLYEIAVEEGMKRQGIGRALMETMSFPIGLKTDADNLASNDFYKRLGFYLMGAKVGKSGKRVNIYQRFS